MTLDVDIEAVFGAFSLSATFRTTGGLTALFGPSGSGKTSLMEVIGGIRRPAKGHISVDGTPLTDCGKRLHLPPHRRGIGWVFQETRLFPHLTGRQNLTYGQWFSRKRKDAEQLDRVVDLLGLGHLLDRRPEHYSGGEKSRVAIGRALMASPRLLLMDEPLAALDDSRKAEIIPYIERLRDEGRVQILYVTHSVAEVVRLANSLVLMSAGKMIAAGPTTDLLARFDIGGALGEGETGAVIEAAIVAHEPAYGLTRLSAKSGELYVPAVDLAVGAMVRLRVRARDVLIGLDRPTGISALNTLAGMIVSLERAGRTNLNIVLDCAGDRLLASITAKSADMLDLRPGRAVYATIKSVSFDRLGLGARPVGEAVQALSVASQSAPRIVAIGGAVLDRKYKAISPVVPATSNPVDGFRSIGGVARNVAENLAKLGVHTGFVSIVGADDTGRAILASMRAAGIDVSGVQVSDRAPTAEYVALIGPDNELAVAAADMRVFDGFTAAFVDGIQPQLMRAEWVFADCNLSASALARLITLKPAAGFKLAIDAVSTPKVTRLPKDLTGVDLLFLNLDEALVLSKTYGESEAAVSGHAVSAALNVIKTAEKAPKAAQVARKLLEFGVGAVIVTLGAQGAIYANRSDAARVQPVAASPIDITGAGDAMIAATLARLIAGDDVPTAARTGMLLGALTTETTATVHPDLSPAFIDAHRHRLLDKGP